MFFFDAKPAALPLYETFREAVIVRWPDTRIEAKKSQISFFNRRMFSAVSFTPVRKAKDRPDPFLTITFGLSYRKDSVRVDVATEPYPLDASCNGTTGELDDEMLSWLVEGWNLPEAKSESHERTAQKGSSVEQKRYEYDGTIHEIPDNGGAYTIFPWNIRKEFRMGRVKVHAEFDGIPYDGNIVNMGGKDEDGNVCYVIC